MLKMLLRLAIVAPCILLLTSCQTPTSAFSTEVAEAVKPLDRTAAEMKQAFCEGQLPQEVPPEIYNSLDDFSKRYISGNNDQWLGAGCRI